MVKIIIVDVNNLIKGGKDIYDEMTATPYSIDYSWEHCHGAFLKIKNKYNTTLKKGEKLYDTFFDS